MKKFFVVGFIGLVFAAANAFGSDKLPKLTSPAGEAFDLPAWTRLFEQASDFFPEGKPLAHYYELLKNRKKDVNHLRSAVMALIETSEFNDPWENWSIPDRATIYEERLHLLGDPQEAALRLVQQLALENLAAEFLGALPLAEKLHFANQRLREAYFDIRSAHPVVNKRKFSEEEEARLKRYCQNALNLARFLEMLPGGDKEQVGIERSNALLVLFYAVQGQRVDSLNTGRALCEEAFKAWPRLVQYRYYGEVGLHETWNFSLPQIDNFFDHMGRYDIYDEHEVLFLKWKTRNRGFEDDKDRYQAGTSCGLVEVEGARSGRTHEDYTYPYFDPHYRWAGPIAESCRSPAGGVNYDNVHQVMKAWTRRLQE